MVDVLAHDANPEGIVHGFIEEVAVELDNVGVMLRLKQLHCFLLIAI